MLSYFALSGYNCETYHQGVGELNLLSIKTVNQDEFVQLWGHIPGVWYHQKQTTKSGRVLASLYVLACRKSVFVFDRPSRP